MRENDSPPFRPIYAASRIKDTRVCYNCGEGHFPKPLKSSHGRGRGNIRGAIRGGRGRGGRNWSRANVAATKEELETSIIDHDATTELREQPQTSKDKDQESWTGDFVNFAYTNEGNYAHAFY
jgi:hypothetical protein